MNSKRVILYTRVSSDEQNDRLSIEAQERSLVRYCENNGYEIVGEDIPYKEDYSAKHYDLRRPEIKRIYEFCKRNKGKVDLVLFLRWDRYSRNVEFAFAYKRMFLDELGVEINAVEEPIDFSATDWPMWLSIRCGVAHTEDIKISRRTQEGIHEHLMRGEWCGKAPRGYKNIPTDEEAGRDHYIEKDPNTAPLIQTIFQEVAKGIETPASIKRRFLPKASKSSFFKMLRNKFYIGIIEVPAFREFEACTVRGRHEPIIDEETFYAVQEIMDGKHRKKPRLSGHVRPNLYLRKFITCPVCGHRLTGATSKGHGGYYDYYCCNKDHKHLNVRAERANERFVEYVSALRPQDAVVELYKEILLDKRGARMRENQSEADKLQKEVDKLQGRIDRVNDLFIDGDLDKSDRDQQIARYKANISELQTRIKFLHSSKDLQVKDKIGYGINVVENLGQFFCNASTETKIKLIGSIFNSEIEFDGEKYRTSDFNSVLNFIFQNANELQGKTNADSSFFSEKSAWVARRGIEPLFKV